MANFRHYGETPLNFPELQYLTTRFAQMTENEQGFMNQIRHLYFLAWRLSAKTGEETGSHVFLGGHWCIWIG
jgi:hypothetical protein